MKNIYIAILFFVAIATSATAILRGRIDGFGFANIAASSIVDSSGHVQTNPFIDAPNAMGQSGNLRNSRFLVIFLPVFLHQITGMPLTLLHFLPLTGLILPIVGYTLARKLFRSSFFGFLFGLFLALESQNLATTYNLNIQGYGSLFYLLIIICSLKTNLKTQYDRRNYLLIILFFVMTILSYYGSEFYSFMYISIVALTIRVFRSVGEEIFEPIKRINSLLIFSLAVFLFEPLVYEFLELIAHGYSVNILQTFLRYISEATRKLANINMGPENYINVPLHIFILNISLYLLIALPIAYFLLALFRGRKRIPIIFYAILITGVVDPVLYILWGGYLDNKYILMMFPLLSFIGISSLSQKTKSKLLRKTYIIAILSVIICRFFLIAVGPWADSSFSHIHARQNDFNWISNHSEVESKSHRTYSHTIYLTDVLSAGQLLLAYTFEGKNRKVVPFMYKSYETAKFLYCGSPESFKLLKEQYSYEGTVDFIILSTDNFLNPILGANWLILPPLSNATLFESIIVNVVYFGYSVILLKV